MSLLCLRGILFKVATFTFKTLQFKSPSYLSDLLVPKITTRNLRSNNKHLLVVPRVDSALGRHSFAFSAPTLWNSLMENDNLRECFVNGDLLSFGSKLKTHLFPPWTITHQLVYRISTSAALDFPSGLFDLLTGRIDLSRASLKLQCRSKTKVKLILYYIVFYCIVFLWKWLNVMITLFWRLIVKRRHETTSFE